MMKLARIVFVVVVALLIGLSIAALNVVHKNRLTMDRNCQMYRAWLEWDKQAKGGAFGPIASMESKCGDTWRAWIKRKMEWELP